MSKRLLRLFPPFTQDSLALILARDINAVRRDGRTLFGSLESFDGDSLLLRDLRSHPHRILFTNIAEIIYDQKAETIPKIGEVR
ncbi:hypothetical protein [Persicitalea sp.]|uniref:hypothetical protein n=1 Tax=Persicitalea sp. TaxID=3100273 RepID=UPI00359458FE